MIRACLRYSSNWQRWICAAGSIALFQLATEPSVAQNNRDKSGPVNVIVQPFEKAFRITISTRTGQPVRQDVSYQVVVKNSSTYGPAGPTINTEVITLRAGTSSVTSEVQFPTASTSFRDETVLHVEVNDNGVVDRNDIIVTRMPWLNNYWLEVPFHLFVSSNVTSPVERKFIYGGRIQDSCVSGGLTVADMTKLPSFRNLGSYFQSLNVNSGTIANDLTVLQNDDYRIRSTNPAAFFEEWQSLVPYQSILISKPDLKTLVASENKRESLRNWLAAGGNLIVFDCDADYQDRLEIIRPFYKDNLPPSDLDWRAPTAGLLAEMKNENAGSNYSGQYSANTSSISEFENALESADSLKNRLLVRGEFSLGSVVLVAGDMTSWSESSWRTLFHLLQFNSLIKTLGKSVWQTEFQNSYLVPGIGKPPVTAFTVLISLFVILIGPGFYFLFHFTKRMHLMLIAAPLLSLLFALSMIGYGILKDGFSIRGRVESVSFADHQAGVVTTLARRVYYSGVSPGRFQFDAKDLAIAALIRRSPVYYRVAQDSMQVSGSQFRARMPIQFSDLGFSEIDNPLTFSTIAGEQESGRILNGYAKPIRLAVVRADNGWYLAENIEPGTTALAELSTADELSVLLRELLMVNEEQVYYNHSRYQRFYSFNQNDWGVASTIIGEVRSGVFTSLVEEKGYLLLFEQSEFVDEPLAATEYGEDQLHVVIGKW